jgi:flagellar hook-associated protein 3 FlgL
MRVTPFTLFNQLTQALDSTLQDYSKLNETLASGKKIQAPSDDVNGMMRAMDYQLNINDNNQYTRNIATAATGLKFTDTILTSVSDTLLKIKSMITLHSSNVSDPMTIAMDSQTATSLKNMLLDLANTKISDQYVFSGFKSDTQPYQNTSVPALDYQGDSGKVNIPVNKGATVQANVTGNDAFSYTIGAPGTTYVKQISGGLNVHYTQGAGTTIDVEIRQADDVSRPADDTFSFSNVMQMTDLLSSAISTNNADRVQALAEPFSQYQTQLATTQTSVGTRLNGLQDQSALLSTVTNTLQDSLSSVTDANMLEVIARIKQTEIALQAIRDSAGRVLQQSLFDFLK